MRREEGTTDVAVLRREAEIDVLRADLELLKDELESTRRKR